MEVGGRGMSQLVKETGGGGRQANGRPRFSRSPSIPTKSSYLRAKIRQRPPLVQCCQPTAGRHTKKNNTERQNFKDNFEDCWVKETGDPIGK